MKRTNDITGMRSGKVTALYRTDKKKRGSYLWMCQCDCGKQFLVESYKIKSHNIKSCGCDRHTKLIKDLTGMRFGRLIALENTGQKSNTCYIWKCQCDCGNITYVTSNSLLSHNTKSCGCQKIDVLKENMGKYGTIADHVQYVEGTCIEKISSKELQSNNTSGYKGIHKQGEKWVATIGFQGRNIYLGIYDDIKDAVIARQTAEEELYKPLIEKYS